MITTLHDLLGHELQDLYSAEQQILEALPTMITSAKSEELVEALTKHQEQTEGHVKRLEQIAQDLGFSLESNTCQGMQGIIEEGEKIIEMELPDPLADIAMIAAAQRAEHYEIAGYGTALAYAHAMEHDEAADLLEETLDEEEETDELLSGLTESLQQEAPMMEEGN